MRKSLLRLFKAVQIDEKNRSSEFSQQNLERMISNGYILDHKIFAYSYLLDEIENVLGLSAKNANATFHKSWKVVRDSDIMDLAIQQIMHYFTTYGFEAYGIYDEKFVYIPNEELEIPEIMEDIKLVYVKGLTSQEILEKIIELGSGIALGNQTISDIMNIIEFNNYSPDFVDEIGNRELQIRLYDFYGIAPKNPIDYLRFVLYKTIGQTLLIKDSSTIYQLRFADPNIVDDLIRKAPENLATIFFRYKPLFLALKQASNNKTFFNRLRKQADKAHVPFEADYLNSVTKNIKVNKLDLSLLKKELENTNTFRKIRLANALNFRINHNGNVLYRIRNGKGWADEFDWDESLSPMTINALHIVIASVVEDIKEKVNGKTFYIPEGITYALPTSEKQFMGNIPDKSYLKVKDDMIVGIHWTNTHKRVDLDLSLIDTKTKYGWDGFYRSSSRDIIFSGDITDAPPPNGASELYYLQKAQELPKIVYVNYYNRWDDEELDCELFVANEKPLVFKKQYMVDPNNIVARTLVHIDQKETTLGFIISIDGENRFYFSNTSIGKEISSSKNEISAMTLDYFIATCSSQFYLRDVLVSAGAKITRDQEEEFDFDFSPEKIDKTDIINIFQ